MTNIQEFIKMEMDEEHYYEVMYVNKNGEKGNFVIDAPSYSNTEFWNNEAMQEEYIAVMVEDYINSDKDIEVSYIEDVAYCG